MNSGGIEVVLPGGQASNTMVDSGGVLEIIGGALLSGTTTIGFGGTLAVGWGYTLSNYVVSSGMLVLASGGSLGSAVSFAGSGGMLTIDGTSMLGTVISGFVQGDTINLREWVTPAAAAPRCCRAMSWRSSKTARLMI